MLNIDKILADRNRRKNILGHKLVLFKQGFEDFLLQHKGNSELILQTENLSSFLDEILLDSLIVENLDLYLLMKNK